MAWADAPGGGKLGWASSRRAGSHVLPGWCPHPSPCFRERRSGCLPFLESHRKEIRAAIFVWHFSVSATEKQNQPRGLFNCNMKKSCFFKGKRRVLHPFGFQRKTVSADSVPFKPKQAHLSSQKLPFKRTLSTGLYFTSNVPKPN